MGLVTSCCVVKRKTSFLRFCVFLEDEFQNLKAQSFYDCFLFGITGIDSSIVGLVANREVDLAA